MSRILAFSWNSRPGCFRASLASKPVTDAHFISPRVSRDMGSAAGPMGDFAGVPNFPCECVPRLPVRSIRPNADDVVMNPGYPEGSVPAGHCFRTRGASLRVKELKARIRFLANIRAPANASRLDSGRPPSLRAEAEWLSRHSAPADLWSSTAPEPTQALGVVENASVKLFCSCSRGGEIRLWKRRRIRPS